MTLGLDLVELGNSDDLALDVGESVVWNVFDLVLDAMLLEGKATTGEEEVALASCCKIADAVPDEDDHWDGTVLAFKLGLRLVLFNAEGFVVSQLGVVAPYWFPCVTFDINDSIVGDDLDAAALLLSKEVVQDSSKHWLQAGGDHIERDVVVSAELMKLLEVSVDLESFLKCFEAVFKGDVE